MYILLSFSQPLLYLLSLNPILLKLFCNLGVQSLLTLIPSAFYDWIDICSIFSVTVSLCCVHYCLYFHKWNPYSESPFFLSVCIHWTSKNMVLTGFVLDLLSSINWESYSQVVRESIKYNCGKHLHGWYKTSWRFWSEFKRGSVSNYLFLLKFTLSACAFAIGHSW